MAEVENTSQKDFGNTPRGWAQRWTVEFAAARKFLDPWHRSADICLTEYMDDRDRGAGGRDTTGEQHVNLFWANIATQCALMYGRTPQADVTRRHDDADDDAARVAGPVILQRLLNTDIERDEDGYRRALRHGLGDYLRIGFCNARVRYVADFEGVPEDKAKGTQAYERKRRNTEDVATDYIYWRDQLYSPCRTFELLRWWGYKTPMTREEVEKRFGKEVAARLSYEARTIALPGADSDAGSAANDVFGRCEVWEIWSKEHKKVFWFVEGQAEILEQRDDPYQLRGFWPFPEPLLANTTTSAWRARPDYTFAQDLYQDINTLSTRIALLEQAVKVAGVYDGTEPSVQNLLSPSAENKMWPVSQWAMFAEKGGLKGVMDFLPIEAVVAALERLREQRNETRQLLYEVTGWSDLMRGAQSQGDETATSAAQRGRYGSVRIQHQQDEFARFATDLQRLRGELIAKLFDPETIIERSNVMMTPDRDIAMQAVQLLKQEFPSYRIEVKPEALAQQDFASLQNERVQLVTALAQLLRDAAPALQALGPMAATFIGELVKWTLAGFRGASSIEGVLDKAIRAGQEAAQKQAAAGPPPDPKLQAVQAKAQADEARERIKVQSEAQRQAIKTQAEAQRQQLQLRFNIEEETMRTRIRAEADARRAALRPQTPAGAPAGGTR